MGVARWDGEEERRGIFYGLVVMGQGEGGILPARRSRFLGCLRLTGSLGGVCASPFRFQLYGRVLTLFCFLPVLGDQSVGS
jgi:hypothetical protein